MSTLTWTTTAPIVGRRAEMNRLFAAIAQGRSPIFLEGPRGIGRTHLMHVFGEAAAGFAWSPKRVRVSSRLSAGAVATLITRALGGPSLPYPTVAHRNERQAQLDHGPRQLVLARMDDGPEVAASTPAAAALIRLALRGHLVVVAGSSFPRALAREVITLRGLEEPEACAFFIGHCGDVVPPHEVVSACARLLDGHPARLRLAARLTSRRDVDAARVVATLEAQGVDALGAMLAQARPAVVRAWGRLSGWWSACPLPLAQALLDDDEAIPKLMDAGLAWRDPFAWAPGISLHEGHLPAMDAPSDSRVRVVGERFLVPAIEHTSDGGMSRDLVLAAWPGLEALERTTRDEALGQAFRVRLIQAAQLAGLGPEAQQLIERAVARAGVVRGASDALTVLRARALLWRGEARSALELIDARSAMADDDNGAAWATLAFHCGEVLLAEGELELAARALELAARHPLVCAEALVALAAVYESAGARDLAVATLEHALVGAADAGDHEQALAILTKVIDVLGDDGDWEVRARQAFELAIGNASLASAPEVALHVAERLACAGALAEARGALAQIAARWPEHAELSVRAALLQAQVATAGFDEPGTDAALADAEAGLARLADVEGVRPLRLSLAWRRVQRSLLAGTWRDALIAADAAVREGVALGRGDDVVRELEAIAAMLRPADGGAATASSWLASVARAASELGVAQVHFHAARLASVCALAAGDHRLAAEQLARAERVLACADVSAPWRSIVSVEALTELKEACEGASERKASA